MENFLRMHKKIDGQIPTHTRIPDKSMNIYGGSYFIVEEDLDIFHHLYFNEVIVAGKDEYLTEKQIDNGVIYIDFDFKYSYDVVRRQHNKDDIKNLVILYTEILKDYFIFDDTAFNIYILEKDNVNQLEDKQITKDGIHMIIGIKMNHKLQLDLRQQILTKINEILPNLPLTNTWDLVLDEGLSKGTTNAQMFGSKKPIHDAYKLTYIYYIQIDLNDYEFMITSINDFNINFETFKSLSVQNINFPEFNLTTRSKNIITPILPISYVKQIYSNTKHTSTTFLEVQQYINHNCLSSRVGIGKHVEWVNIGIHFLSLFTDEEALTLWELLTELYGTDHKKSECKEHFIKYIKRKEEDKHKVLNTIRKWARDENPEEYKKIQYEIKHKETVMKKSNVSEYFLGLTDKERETFIEIIEPTINSPTEYDFALAFYKIFGHNFVCIDKKNKIFYEYTNNLWSQSEGVLIWLLISTKFYDIYNGYANTLYDTELINKIQDISKKLKKTSDKNNIVSELINLCYNDKFICGFNTAKNVLPIKNGKIIDMNTLIISDRTIDNKFTYECPVNYIDETELNKEEFEWTRKYFNDLFSGNKDTMKVFLNCIKTTFSGQILRHIFICTGDGSNGKSLLFKCIGEIFSNAMDTISEKVFIQSKSTSNLNTEIEKLDKIRCGFMSEIDDTAKLNEKMIKAISGGDKLNLRGICKTDKTIIPTATLWGAFNIEPEFNVEKAMINRIVNFPFNANFETDVNFENKLLSMKDYIFSFIMKNGSINHKVEPSEEMMVKKRKYVADNTKDNLKDYIQSNIKQHVESKPNSKRHTWCIKRDDFRKE